MPAQEAHIDGPDGTEKAIKLSEEERSRQYGTAYYCSVRFFILHHCSQCCCLSVCILVCLYDCTDLYNEPFSAYTRGFLKNERNSPMRSTTHRQCTSAEYRERIRICGTSGQHHCLVECVESVSAL